MIRNKALVSRAKVFARDCDEKRRDQIGAMVEGYEVACELSVGPDASRSKAWEGNAARRRTQLCTAIGYQE